jgi:hypothetical protein
MDNPRSVRPAACCESPINRAAGSAARAWQDAPLRCTGSSDEVAGIARLLASLASKATAPPERTAAGYALRFPPSPKLERLASEFIRREGVCCPFLEFRLDRGGTDVRLEVSGPEDAQGTLDLSFELCRVAQAK